MLDVTHLLDYWQGSALEANVLIILNLLGALTLGMLVGYERTYHGRAAGIRTYGLVCMASCAMTVFVGYSEFWFGSDGSPMPPDPTRVIQGIVSGIGFLCAGVIMRDGFNINGLTTAASLWASAALGIMIGVGFYGAAIIMALLSMSAMSIGHSLQRKLPVKENLAISLSLKKGTSLEVSDLHVLLNSWGYDLSKGSLTISKTDVYLIWRFTAVAKVSAPELKTKAGLALELNKNSIVEQFSLETARN